MGEKVMTQPKVSVVIPIWNTEKYLEKCLESLVNQTLKDIEIICVNNGSTDSCQQIIDRFARKDSRIKVVNIEHGYLSDSRNKGVEYTEGEYLYFCDSDDWLEPEALEKWYNHSQKHNADLCILQEKRFNQATRTYMNINHRLCALYGCLEDKTYTYKDMKNLFMERFEAWLHFYKREFFINNKLYYPSKTFYEDVIIHFKSMFYAKSIVFCFEPLYTWRFRQDASCSKSHNTPEKLDAIVYLEDVYNLLIDLNLFDTYKSEYVQMLLNQMNYHIKNCGKKYKRKLINLLENFVNSNKNLKDEIISSSDFKSRYNRFLRKKLLLNSVIDFVLKVVRVYLLFPWYTYKIYKMLKKRGY